MRNRGQSLVNIHWRITSRRAASWPRGGATHLLDICCASRAELGQTRKSDNVHLSGVAQRQTCGAFAAGGRAPVGSASRHSTLASAPLGNILHGRRRCGPRLSCAGHSSPIVAWLRLYCSCGAALRIARGCCPLSCGNVVSWSSNALDSCCCM